MSDTPSKPDRTPRADARKPLQEDRVEPEIVRRAPPPEPPSVPATGSSAGDGATHAPEGAHAEGRRERLRRKGQDPHFERGVDAKEMWRIFRIISEYVEAIDGLRDVRPAISMWGSARLPPDNRWYRLTQETAKRLAQMGYSIITGGGPGVMEAANRGCKEGGGKSVGLGIHLPMEQEINDFCDIAIDFDYFFIRKMMFTKFAAGLVVAPGGFGTLDEMFDTLTLIQTRKIRRIPVVLLGAAYFGPLVAWMRQTLLPEGTISKEDPDLWLLTDDPAEAAEYLDRHVVNQTWWEGGRGRSASAESP